METMPWFHKEPVTLSAVATIGAANSPGAQTSISLQRRARWTARRLAGVLPFLAGIALLAAGMTGCGRERTVAAAGRPADAVSPSTSYGPATVPAELHHARMADHHDDEPGGHHHGDRVAEHHDDEASEHHDEAAHHDDEAGEHHNDEAHHHDGLDDDEHAEMEKMLAGQACPMSHVVEPDPPTAAERRLFLTPGGRYTAADIAINGPILPGQRFRGVESVHDMHPQPGDRLCPITGTRASPRFAWIVGGKAYQFCCPPCVEEFVRQAKERPRTIRPPEYYVKH
jgi:hypothetical protein